MAGTVGEPTGGVARVLIDSSLPQLDRLFDYRIPPELAAVARPGVRVRVPLRSAGRIADGFIVEVAGDGDYSGVLSDLEAVVSPIPVLAPEVWALARRLADRAAGTASDIVRLAVPKRQVRIEKAWLEKYQPTAADIPVSPDREPARAEPAGASAVLSETVSSETVSSETVLPQTVLSQPVLPQTALPQPVYSETVLSQPVLPQPVDGFDLGLVESAMRSGARLAVDAVPRVVELPDGHWVGHWATTMAAAASQAIARGGSAILAVPDYRDQDQLVAALRAVLPHDRIVHLDAKQSNPDRYRAVLACLGDIPLAVVGNRSVIYAPAKRLGLIALWDEGDPLHAEPLSPYVHSRDAALVRQEQQGSTLLFLSHARSTEIERLVEVGYLKELAPERLVQPRVLPTAQQQSEDRLAAQARIPSSAWRQARTALENGPVLVQVARPGYAPRLACTECGQTARCEFCEGPLRLKSARATPSCSWCGKLATDWSCSNCTGTTFRLVGQGTGRTAEDLGRAFPGVRVIVADGDRPILKVGSEPALVIATRGAEPIAAGGYRAILLLDGERMTARESLRVGEDCVRWWSNAIALAAPGATTVLVGVGGALASALATWRRADYIRAELADRRALRFPPAVRVATVTGTPESVQRAVDAVSGIERVDVLGPVDAPGGVIRAIVRFDYGEGAAVASGLRAEVIRIATSRRKRPGPAGPAALPTLRVRFDDVSSFDTTEQVVI